MPKILVVEDNPEILELIRMILKPLGYEILHDSKGSQAVQLCKKIKPNLILLDVALPESDGYTIQTKLLEDNDTKDVPILIMTSKYQVEEIFETARNVVGYVSKPFDIQQFRQKVQSVIEK